MKEVLEEAYKAITKNERFQLHVVACSDDGNGTTRSHAFTTYKFVIWSKISGHSKHNLNLPCFSVQPAGIKTQEEDHRVDLNEQTTALKKKRNRLPVTNNDTLDGLHTDC